MQRVWACTRKHVLIWQNLGPWTRFTHTGGSSVWVVCIWRSNVLLTRHGQHHGLLLWQGLIWNSTTAAVGGMPFHSATNHDGLSIWPTTSGVYTWLTDAYGVKWVYGVDHVLQTTSSWQLGVPIKHLGYWRAYKAFGVCEYWYLYGSAMMTSWCSSQHCKVCGHGVLTA